MAHLILFTDANFQGEHKHIFDRADALSLVGIDDHGHSVCVADCDFPDGVSSIVIFSGNWQFGQGENQTFLSQTILGPGLYPFVGTVKLTNDNIRSLMPVTDDPTMPGDPLNGEVILFENKNFRGAHQHVFKAVDDLGNFDFARKASAIVVKSGNWSFYSDTQFDGSYPQQPVFGPGIYPWVEDLGIGNDTISSLQPSGSVPTIANSVDNEVILFQFGGMYGLHRHVFAPEANLNADDDNSFNDNVGSLVVLAGIWSFYADWNFDANYGIPGSPGLYPVLSALNIATDDMSSLRPFVASPVTPGDAILGHVILFQDAEFQGPHKHVFNQEDNLNANGDDGFNDSVSSLAVLQGNWQFFRNAGFHDDYPVILGPGLYPSVEAVNIRNDDMSSLQVVQAAATMTGDPVTAHIILFKDASFHGAHKHVFVPEPNLDDSSFNDLTSSIVVLEGQWATYGDWNFQRQYLDPSQNAIILGPGESKDQSQVPSLYRWVEDVQIPNDDLTSLQPVDQAVTSVGEALLGQLLLFKDANFRGDHKHIFNAEADLNAGDDDSFNDATSSIAVLEGNWFSYRDAGFQRAYDATLGVGLFGSVEAVGIANDEMSSLSLAGDRQLFIGTATIKIKSGQVPDPVVVPVAMTFVVDLNAMTFHVENGFGPIALLSLGTIAYDGADPGSFTATGEMSIPNFHITASGNVDGIPVSADATFLMSTGTANSPNGDYMETGSPVSMPALMEGNVALVAAGNLNGDDFSIKLVGTLTASS